MKTETYDAGPVLGLPVTLAGVVSRDEEGTIEIPRLDMLLATVAVTRALDPEQLFGTEIRFLRHVLNFTGSEFAEEIDLSDKTVVSRWENGRTRPGGYTEKVIRQLVLNLLARRAPGVRVGENAIPGMKIRPRDEALPMTFTWRRRRLADGRTLRCYVPLLQHDRVTSERRRPSEL